MYVFFIANLQSGEKLAICGQNGSGKSTLLKLIAGLDQNDSGALTRNKGASIGCVCVARVCLGKALHKFRAYKPEPYKLLQLLMSMNCNQRCYANQNVFMGLFRLYYPIRLRSMMSYVRYLPQDPQLPEEATVLQAVLQSDSAAARAVQSYEKALSTAGGGVTKVCTKT